MAWLARRDGSVLLGHGPFTASAEPPADGVAFHISDFALEEPLPWRVPQRCERIDAADLAGRFPDSLAVECDFQTPDATPFSTVFQEVMGCIHAGLFEKTVPVVTEQGHAAGPPGRLVPGAMAACRPPLMSYGWVEPGRGFAGATPELLFSLRDGHLETMALAGTARSEDRDVFAVDGKEIREHEYVAQSLMAKLVDLGTPVRSPREILDLGSIVHFLTPLHMDLAGTVQPADLIRRLHPTPALGPLPRNETTMRKLLEWRTRLDCPGGFGAPFGVLDHGRFDVVVAIRGVWWRGNLVRIPSGCGIIEASRLVNEWRELRLKREAVKDLLHCRHNSRIPRMGG
jgi:menaquinone-specific isochorismate synthase